MKTRTFRGRGIARALAGALAIGGIAACANGGALGRPVASVGSSKEAAAAFAALKDGWSPDPKVRIQFQPALVAFVARFPNDGLTPLARAYLVFALIDMGDLREAGVQLARLDTPPLPPGATSDLAEIARAKLLRLTGQANVAFERIRDLVGKLVDPVSRSILNQEIALDAVDAKRDYEAIAYMDAWLRNASEEDRDAVRAEVTAALEKEPDAVLETTLRVMRTGGAASGYGREIQRLVTERLAAVALARNDSDLARWLVSGDSNVIGTEEGALGELATTKRGLASVDGRTIGLVLPTGSTDLRDEAAAIMRGAAWALDLPRDDPSKGDRAKLATRDDGGDATRVEPTMAELAGDGAVVILAALDPVSAERAVGWGEKNGVPVIVLAVPPPSPAKRDWAFVAGEARASEIAVLAEELVSRAAQKIVPIVPPSGSEAVQALARANAVVSDGGAPSNAKPSLDIQPPVACDTAAAESGEAHFPIDDWKLNRVRAWLVDAPCECTRDLLHGLGAAGLSGVVGLTLDAAGSPSRLVSPGVLELAVRAAEIPVTALTPDAVSDPEVRAWFAREGTPPNWWAALGHDAGILARRAVANLPLDSTSEPGEVAKRRAAAKDALAAARAHLWTSEADGFDPDHLLARDLKVVDLAASQAPPKPETKAGTH